MLNKYFMTATLTLVVGVASFAQGTRYYVNKAANVSSPTGLSWSSPFSDIQDAIDAGSFYVL